MNILTLFLFSWGTKGDNAVQLDLGVASKVASEKGFDTVEVDIVDGLDMINMNYEQARLNLETKQSTVKQVRSMTRSLPTYMR